MRIASIAKPVGIRAPVAHSGFTAATQAHVIARSARVAWTAGSAVRGLCPANGKAEDLNIAGRCYTLRARFRAPRIIHFLNGLQADAPASQHNVSGADCGSAGLRDSVRRVAKCFT